MLPGLAMPCSYVTARAILQCPVLLKNKLNRDEVRFGQPPHRLPAGQDVHLSPAHLCGRRRTPRRAWQPPLPAPPGMAAGPTRLRHILNAGHWSALQLNFFEQQRSVTGHRATMSSSQVLSCGTRSSGVSQIGGLRAAGQNRLRLALDRWGRCRPSLCVQSRATQLP